MDKNLLSESAIQSRVQIRRSRRGLFNSKAVQVFVGGEAQQVSVGEEKTFTVRPGNVQVALGTSKLRFRARMGEGKMIEIREGIYNWKYCLKYGFFFLTTIPVMDAILFPNLPGILNFIMISLAVVLMVYYAATEYFYLSEGE